MKYLFFAILLAAHLSACFLNNNVDLDSNQVLSPVSVKLNQGYLAEDVLHLRFEVEAYSKIKVSSVYLKLEGFKGSTVNETQIIPLSTIYDKEFMMAGNRALVPFTLARGQLDHFSISVSFGAEGERIAAILMQDGDNDPTNLKNNSSTSTVSPGLEIVDFKIEEQRVPCSGSSCSNEFYINIFGRLKKKFGTRAIKNAKLAYKIDWIPDGGIPNANISGDLKPDEKLLSFGNEELPDEGYHFEVRGTEPLPSLPGGRFMPSIRILSYEHKN